MPEVVITGASGFIGRALCAELLGRGATVDAVSRARGTDVPGVRERRVGDYARLDGPAGAICVHLAGETRPERLAANLEAERAAAVRVARALAGSGFARVIFASSGLVYGDRAAEPRREKDPVDPRGGYGAAKRAVEEIFLEHGHGVARLSNVYGPGMGTGSVLSDVLDQIPGRGPLRVRDTSPVRDFVHVGDVVRGLADLALSKATGIFNLGTGVGTSIGELAARLAELAGERDREVVATEPSPARTRLVLDPTKMREALGWEATVPLSRGLEDLVREKLGDRSGRA